MQIEYHRNSENAIADALSPINLISINAEVPADFSRCVPSYSFFVADTDRLDARVDWIEQQNAVLTIVRIIHFLSASARDDAAFAILYSPLCKFKN